MDAWKLLTNATIKAIFLIAQSKEIDLDGKNAEIAESLKSVVKVRIPTILQDWETATKSRQSTAWLRELMNAQAHELAIETLKHMNLWEVT